MTFVVARPGGRFEIRETRSVGGRTRSRTLASFRTLDDDVLRHAASRAEQPFDAEAVREAAKAKGALIGLRKVDAIVGELIVEMDGGNRPSPTFEAMVRSFLGGDAATHHLREAEEWAERTMQERGDALVSLLSVVDALPYINRFPSRPFPRLGPHR